MKKFLTVFLTLFFLAQTAIVFAECSTCFMKIAPGLHDQKKQKSRVVFGKAFKIDKDLKEKIKLVTKIDGTPDILPITDKFIVKEKIDILDKDKIKIGTEEEYYPEFTYQSVKVGTLNDGSKVVKILIENQQAKEFILAQNPEATDFDPLSEQNRILLGLDQFIGLTREDVFKAHPETAGQYQAGTDDNGDPVMIDNLDNTIWSCERFLKPVIIKEPLDAIIIPKI